MSSVVLEGGCFTLIWKIQNFSLLLEATKARMWSAVCKVEHTRGSSWKRLNVNHYDGRLNFDQCGHFPIDRSEMCLITSCGDEVPLKRNPGWLYSIEKGAVFGEERQSILPNDTLTLRCRMWGETMKSDKCLIVSVLHRVDYLWNIESFGLSSSNSTCIEQNNCLIYVSLKKSGMGACTVTVVGEPCVDSCLYFVDNVLSIKDGRGRVIDTTNIFPFVHCIFDIEILPEYNASVDFQLESIVALHTTCKGHGSSGALADDLMAMYRETLHTDATLNTEGKSFSAHRNILAARSPVFRAMFEKDQMIEGREGVVDIDDVDSETVDRMLVFLYGDSFDVLQWEEASSLYYAADKYGVLPLKQKCADILKAGLTTGNACGALVLADRHSDQELMKCAVNFIRDYDEVVSSSDWDKLESNNLLLASKTMRQLYLKKGQK